MKRRKLVIDLLIYQISSHFVVINTFMQNANVRSGSKKAYHLMGVRASLYEANWVGKRVVMAIGPANIPSQLHFNCHFMEGSQP